MEVVPSPSTTAAAVAAGYAEYYVAEAPGQIMMPYIMIPQAHREYYNHVQKTFKISFKSNEKNIKNPNQAVVDKTLHCAPNKTVCVYLGNKILPLPGIGYPSIHAYLKFHDDKNRDKLVEICSQHATLSPSGQGRYVCVLNTQSANYIRGFTDNNLRHAHILEFKYPVNEERPSISLSFACRSSCFARTLFKLHIDLVYPCGYAIRDEHLVKVSTNPGRDCGITIAKNAAAVDFARAKGAFSLNAKPRARKYTSSSGSESNPKRATVPEPEQRNDGPELPENGMFTLTIFGIKDYKNLLTQYNMLLTQDKYEQMKNPGQSVILNSQIPATAELDDWLEKLTLQKHKDTLNTNGVHTMMELHTAYHRRYFEDLQIPDNEASVLHSSFIYWHTNYLNECFKKIEIPSDE